MESATTPRFGWSEARCTVPQVHTAARVRQLGPYVLIAWLYLATSPFHHGLNNPNEMVRVYMSVALVDHDSFNIDPVIRDWGMVDDKATREGRLYSSKAPLQSLVGVPAYLVGQPILHALGLPHTKRHVTFILRILGSVSIGLGLAFALLAYCQRRAVALGAERRYGTALGLVLALGTMHYPYSLTFTGHILASATAGGCFIAVALLLDSEERSARGRNLALAAGALGGATPFAEYPAALVALPALVAGLICVSNRRLFFVRLALGGALPFALGLCSHQFLWGSPFETGYGYLENPGYVEVHGRGFFGVTAPKVEALLGSLLSPGTGLFFFSPVLAVGLVPLALSAALGRRALPASSRAMAIAALVGFTLELLFISGHRGWRGGWTLGPRYIIPVVVVLGFGCAEALGRAAWRRWVVLLGAASILLTGPAAALYPHLSDVYSNPLLSFVAPSYARGYIAYGIAHGLGLEGHLANLLHLGPLAVAAGYCAFTRDAPTPWKRRAGVVAVALIGLVGGLALIGEEDPKKARRENRRLWGFWEPAPAGPPRAPPQDLVASARAGWRGIRVTRRDVTGTRSCALEGLGCRYGDEGWQRFGPDRLTMDGRSRAILFMHPIAGSTIEAEVPVPRTADRAVLECGLADASVESDNPHPVELRIVQGPRELVRAQIGEDYGLQELPFALSSTTPLVLSIEVERDGARVFGWNIRFYRRPLTTP